MMAPMAATVAGAEPDTAPKNMHAMTVTIPSEPVTPPMIELAALTRRLDTPCFHDGTRNHEKGQSQVGEAGNSSICSLGNE